MKKMEDMLQQPKNLERVDDFFTTALPSIAYTLDSWINNNFQKVEQQDTNGNNLITPSNIQLNKFSHRKQKNAF